MHFMLRSTIVAHMKDTLNENKFRFKRLQELESEIAWDTLVALIDPHYLSTSVGRNLIPTKTMIRIFFLQVRYGMTASEVEDALFQIEVLRNFALIDIDKDVIPNQIYIDGFNQLLSEKNLRNKIIEHFNI